MHMHIYHMAFSDYCAKKDSVYTKSYPVKHFICTRPALCMHN